jgi:2-polyprenyl-3-methyl-5-hydroxy-6-metoxy-1,4-benzoquinol methylase
MGSEKLWDRMATKWDKPGVSLGEKDIKLIDKTKKYLDAGSVVLDYGCATGSICFELAGTAKAVYGVDFSSKMIDIAKSKALENKTPNVIFINGSIFNETLKNGSFDVITAFSIMHLVEDAPQVFERINKLLKPGGVFISETPCMGNGRLLSTLIEFPLFLASKTGMVPRINFFKAKGLADTITKANFKIVENNDLSSGAITEVYISAKKI